MYTYLSKKKKKKKKKDTFILVRSIFSPFLSLFPASRLSLGGQIATYADHLTHLLAEREKKDTRRLAQQLWTSLVDID